MQFRLLYTGLLRAGAKNRKHIHEIRRHLRPQLAGLWEFPPLKMASTQKMTAGIIGYNEPPEFVDVAGTQFQPVIHSKLSLLGEIEILFLRPEEPGALFDKGGDLDNRVKTLFDALKPPDENQAVNLGLENYPSPFHVLLEDDKLVSGFSVVTDRLLPSTTEEQKRDDVHLTITVRVTATHAHMDNLHLLGP